MALSPNVLHYINNYYNISIAFKIEIDQDDVNNCIIITVKFKMINKYFFTLYKSKIEVEQTVVFNSPCNAGLVSRRYISILGMQRL